jgi:hypothetical protein
MPKPLRKYAIQRATELGCVNHKYSSLQNVVRMTSNYRNGFGRDNKHKRAIREWFEQEQLKLEQQMVSAGLSSSYTYTYDRAVVRAFELIAQQALANDVDPFNF